MLEIKKGKITEEIFSRDGIQAFFVDLEGNIEKCLVYTDLIPEISTGDEVLLNTTAESLGLGSGGYHFVIANLNNPCKNMELGGHIMKLRYTPMQIKVCSVEEEESPYREIMQKANDLENTPVIVATLHSMLAPIAILLHEAGYKPVYLMTDGAALAMSMSQTVDWLKENKIIQGTVSIGNAFGGDLEAVNVYSGMLAAKHVLQADIIIVSMGPGIVGTGSKWGFTGVEQGEILNAVDVLKGIPIAVPRISFKDLRERHRGISHHSITVLSEISRVKALVPIPIMEDDKLSYIKEQIATHDLYQKCDCILEKGDHIKEVLAKYPHKFSTMGRGVEEEIEFFMTLAASAETAIKIMRGEELEKMGEKSE